MRLEIECPSSADSNIYAPSVVADVIRINGTTLTAGDAEEKQKRGIASWGQKLRCLFTILCRHLLFWWFVRRSEVLPLDCILCSCPSSASSASCTVSVWRSQQALTTVQRRSGDIAARNTTCGCSP